MGLIQSSGDVLNIIIGISILALTFFVCWVLYYVARSFYNLFKITKEARDGVVKAREVLELLKKRLSSTLALVHFVEEISHKALDMVQSYTKKDSSGKKTTQKKTAANKKKK